MKMKALQQQQQQQQEGEEWDSRVGTWGASE